MTADSQIRAALDAAGEAVRLRARFSPLTGSALSQDFAAAAIATFLRACPVITDLPPGPDRMGFWDADARERWAAAVEAAAGEQTP